MVQIKDTMAHKVEIQAVNQECLQAAWVAEAHHKE